MNKVCIICEEEFLTKSHNKKTCSDLCRKKHNSNRNKRWMKCNPQKNSLNSKMWREKNPEKEKEIQKNKQTKRRKEDSLYRTTMNLRRRMRLALHGENKSKNTFILLGCNQGELKEHLEKQFTYGMNWDNYGKFGWHIDHIIPCSDFDMADTEQQKKCFHYTNLQPLWWYENLEKRFRKDK